MGKYKHGSHKKGTLKVHLIFVTKFRTQIFLNDEIDEYIKTAFVQIASRHGLEILEIETDKDHIHLLVEYSPKQSISEISKFFKQESLYMIWEQYPKVMRKHYWHKEKQFWSKGYFYCSIGEVSQDAIEKYIQNQG